MAARKPPTSDVGKALYALLQRAAKKEFKSCNWYKAHKLLNEFECCFVDEAIMISGSRRILKLGKQLPPELADRDD